MGKFMQQMFQQERAGGSIKKHKMKQQQGQKGSGKGSQKGSKKGSQKGSQKGSGKGSQKGSQKGSEIVKYQKVPGTRIQVIGGDVKRVVGDRTFAPNDIRGAESYIAKHGLPQPTAGGGKKNRRREKGGQQHGEQFVQSMGKNQKQRAAKGASKGARAAKGASKGALQQAPKGQYQKLKGTSIRTLEDGRVVRIIGYDQKQYAVNDIRGAEAHLAKGGVLASGGGQAASKGKGKGKGKKQQQQVKGKGKGKGSRKGEDSAGPNKKVRGKKIKISKMAKKAAKPLTPEQQAARDQKNAERIAEEGRVVASEHIAGEFVSRAGGFAWVKPLTPSEVPADVAEKLKIMNDEFKAKAIENGRKPFCGGIDTDVVYVRLADVDSAVVVKPGTQCRFKLYTDSKGVGGCEVISV